MNYKLQLWADVKHGLGASLASLKELKEGLDLVDYYLLSKLGVMRMINKELRYIPSVLGEIRLYDLTAETVAVMLNLFL